MKNKELAHMLQGYDVPAILVSKDYEILANNTQYQETFGKVDLSTKPKCFEISHGYTKPCDQAGEDCPLLAAKQSRRKEKVLHIHQTPNGQEHVDVEMIPIFNEDENLEFFVELLKPVPLASGASDNKKVVGSSVSFTRMLSRVTKVAGTDASVLLLGESGTGKELISHLVHMASKRSSYPMVALECSGLSETLIESELFGHKKGAFTGAYNNRKGLVEIADGGTLFLDEIGDVSLSTQLKLLRLIETKTFRRVGETEVRHSDFRLVCATHRDLKLMIEEGSFRLDLYYRINIFPIRVPALSERKEDIPELVEHLLRQIDSSLYMTQTAIQCLLKHNFPGNIRELKNVLIRASILSDTNVIDNAQIREAIDMENDDKQNDQSDVSSLPPLKDQELALIHQLLQSHNGNKKAVAKELGISLRTLYRKLQD